VAHLVLPPREVGVAGRKVRQLRPGTGGKRLVECAELLEQHLGGPPVGHQVVHDEAQHVFGLVHADQRDPEQTPGRQIERRREPLGQHVVHRTARGHVPFDPASGFDHLVRHTITHADRAAQGLMPLDKRFHRAAKAIHVQRAAQPVRLQHVIRGPVRHKRIHEPQGPLSWRERQFAVPWRTGESSGILSARRDDFGQPRHSRGTEELGHRHVDAELVTYQCDQPDQLEARTAGGEQVVLRRQRQIRHDPGHAGVVDPAL
jgi:hypothetical protein